MTVIWTMAQFHSSYPAKLLALLLARHATGLPGPALLPCELIERNGERLRDLVLEQAVRWKVAQDAVEWLRESCRWINSLVDRIVPGPPSHHPLLGRDPLLLSAEPYALWAIEVAGGFDSRPGRGHRPGHQPVFSPQNPHPQRASLRLGLSRLTHGNRFGARSG